MNFKKIIVETRWDDVFGLSSYLELLSKKLQGLCTEIVSCTVSMNGDRSGWLDLVGECVGDVVLCVDIRGPDRFIALDIEPIEFCQSRYNIVYALPEIRDIYDFCTLVRRDGYDYFEAKRLGGLINLKHELSHYQSGTKRAVLGNSRVVSLYDYRFSEGLLEWVDLEIDGELNWVDSSDNYLFTLGFYDYVNNPDVLFNKMLHWTPVSRIVRNYDVYNKSVIRVMMNTARTPTGYRVPRALDSLKSCNFIIK